MDLFLINSQTCFSHDSRPVYPSLECETEETIRIQNLAALRYPWYHLSMVSSVGTVAGEYVYTYIYI